MSKVTAMQVKLWRARNPEKLREIQHKGHVRRKYGLTADDYNNLLLEQGGSCAICKKPAIDNKFLVVDHDHNTNKIRGLLCGMCNSGIGFLGDNPDRCRLAAEYLDRNSDS